jgi:hypothetical protein
VAGRIRSIEKSSGLVGIQTCDLPTCSIVPQPTTLPCAPNYMMKTERFPVRQYSSTLKPLHKKSYKLCILNYRPISVSVIFCKAFENIIYKWVMHCLNCNNIWVNEQFDLVKNLTIGKAVHEDVSTVKYKSYIAKFILRGYSLILPRLSTVQGKQYCSELCYGSNGIASQCLNHIRVIRKSDTYDIWYFAVIQLYEKLALRIRSLSANRRQFQ